MNARQFEAASLADTDRLGAALAECLPVGAVVALNGTLGAGKTRLVRSIAAALGVDPENVVSPTFVLCQQHHGARDIAHLDAYRIADDDEFLELGVDEWFESPALVFIEWGERVERCLPRDRYEIEIAVTGEQDRRFSLAARGEAPLAALDCVMERLRAAAEGQ